MHHPREFLRLLQQQLAALEKYRFLTNSILMLHWHQPSSVNNEPLDIGTRAFTMLLLLAGRALESPGDYLESNAIVEAVERRARLLGDLGLSWHQPTQQQVHSAMSELRLAFRSEAAGHAFIESAPRQGKGYRLSTPNVNIIPDEPTSACLRSLALRSVLFDEKAAGLFPGSNGAQARPPISLPTPPNGQLRLTDRADSAAARSTRSKRQSPR
jgi:hypothetical protein